MKARLEGDNEVTAIGWVADRGAGGPDGKVVVFENTVYRTDYFSGAVHRAPL